MLVKKYLSLHNRNETTSEEIFETIYNNNLKSL